MELPEGANFTFPQTDCQSWRILRRTCQNKENARSKTASPPTDPHAEREADRYENPIASRELILQLLADADHPLNHNQICQQLQLEDHEHVEALRRRLRAMERDGQLLVNRKGAYGLVNKLDLVHGRIIGHRDGYGFLSPYGRRR